MNHDINALIAVVESLAKPDPVVGPFRFQEPRKDPHNFDEKPTYSSRRICGLCKRKSANQGENVTHTMGCPWIPAKKAIAASKVKVKCLDPELHEVRPCDCPRSGQ